MNANLTYLNFHRQLMTDLLARAKAHAQLAGTLEDAQQQILAQLETLCQQPEAEGYYTDAQACLCKIIAAWPQLTPAIARDLLWFVGGDCLQYMPDDEIARFQQLDEARHEAELTGQPFNYTELRSKILGLH